MLMEGEEYSEGPGTYGRLTSHLNRNLVSAFIQIRGMHIVFDQPPSGSNRLDDSGNKCDS